VNPGQRVNERRLLQIVVALACLVPICAGTAGVLLGPAMLDMAGAPADAESHFSYLSGLLLGIGLAFATTIPRIEVQTARFQLLATIVVIGGLGRFLSLIFRGLPGQAMLLGLVMELVVTPALVVWQARIAAQARR
jgi:hypothetical protein